MPLFKKKKKSIAKEILKAKYHPVFFIELAKGLVIFYF